jgi:hypothetical protein
LLLLREETHACKHEGKLLLMTLHNKDKKQPLFGIRMLILRKVCSGVFMEMARLESVQKYGKFGQG